MPEAMEGQVPLDELSQTDYKAARAAGATETIPKAELEDTKPPKVTGEESMKTYKEKRAEQQERGLSKSGIQKRIDRLVRERSELQEKLAHYEAGNGNGAVTEAESETYEAPSTDYELPQSSEPVEGRQRNGAEDSKLTELKQRFPDFDAVMAKARNGNLRIADEAAKELRGLEYGKHVAYILSAYDALRGELNKLPPAQQKIEVRRLSMEVEAIESGRKPFADRVKSTFAENEMKQILKAIDENKTGERVADALVRELHELPNGPEVFRHLMLNADVAKHLEGMSRRAAVLELGRLSARLDRRLVSKAPAPIRPVTGGINRSSVPLDQLDDMSEYKRRRAAGEK